MRARKKDRRGNWVYKGSRVRWVGVDLKFTSEDHKNGYKDVKHGDRGRITSLTHVSGPNMVLILFKGHTKPVSLGLAVLEKV